MQKVSLPIAVPCRRSWHRAVAGTLWYQSPAIKL